MKTKEDAAKVLLENGFSLEDVLNLLGNQQTVIYPYVPYIPTVQPWWVPVDTTPQITWTVSSTQAVNSDTYTIYGEN